MSYSAYDESHLPSATRVGSRRTYGRTSWGSIFAGAVVAGASMILLSRLGVAFGAGGLRFTQTIASDMASYGLGAGIWTAINLILCAMSKKEFDRLEVLLGVQCGRLRVAATPPAPRTPEPLEPTGSVTSTLQRGVFSIWRLHSL